MNVNSGLLDPAILSNKPERIGKGFVMTEIRQIRLLVGLIYGKGQNSGGEFLDQGIADSIVQFGYEL